MKVILSMMQVVFILSFREGEEFWKVFVLAPKFKQYYSIYQIYINLDPETTMTRMQAFIIQINIFEGLLQVPGIKC